MASGQRGLGESLDEFGSTASSEKAGVALRHTNPARWKTIASESS